MGLSCHRGRQRRSGRPTSAIQGATERAKIPPGHRVRGDALQRLAGAEERANGPGRVAPGRARGDRRHRTRDAGVGPHRRGRARRRAGRASRSSERRPARDAAAADERRLARRHQRARDRARPSQVPRPPRRRFAQLRLSGRPPPDGVRQAVCLVGERGSRRAGDAGSGRRLRRHARLPLLHRQRPRRGVDPGPGGRGRGQGGRRPRPGPRRRIAFRLEDGAPRGGRAG